MTAKMEQTWTKTPIRAALLAVLLTASTAGAAYAGGDWNDGAIAWMEHDKGLAAAREEGKPVCLVLYTEWCPHCTNYSAVFHDPKVVDQAKDFVMIRVDKDRYPELSRRYVVDGDYIPRTFFLSSQGELVPKLAAPRRQYRYFYDEHDPTSILAGMESALRELAKAGSS